MTRLLLRLEPAEQAAPLTVNLIEQAAREHGLALHEAMRTDRIWFVQASTTGGATVDAVRLPDGWRVVEARPVLEHKSWADAGDSRAVGEIFTYALLLWPAVVGLFALHGEGWQLALKIALAVWLGLLHLVAYRQGRGAFFGNSLLMLSACVAAFWWTHPGPWMYLWLIVVVIGLYAAVRGVLKRRTPGSDPAPASSASRQGTG
jgi:hypothetical protein